MADEKGTRYHCAGLPGAWPEELERLLAATALRERQECTALRRRVCDERPRERAREEREESGSGKETCDLVQAQWVVGQAFNRHDLPPAAGETRRCD
jgi:hypothetical protein